MTENEKQSKLKTLQSRDMEDFAKRPVSRARPATMPRALWANMAADLNRGPTEDEVRRHKAGAKYRAEQRLMNRALAVLVMAMAEALGEPVTP